MQNIIGRKYKVLEMIGKGSFGIIVKGEHVRTQDKVAIKIERVDASSNMLKNESKIYLLLNKEECSYGFPTIKWFGKDEQFCYMVMELLGESLSTFKHQSSFPLNVVIKIGEQIVARIKTVHSRGVIHRDIKPDNFLFGLGRTSQTVHLIDFGFCKSYLTLSGTHVMQTRDNSIVGTPNFVSISAHEGYRTSRRDDIESAIYVLIYLFLPLQKWNNTFKQTLTNDAIKMEKHYIRSSDDLIPHQFINVLKYCDELKYEDEPNYELIINILNGLKTI
jgi:casein kinase 1